MGMADILKDLSKTVRKSRSSGLTRALCSGFGSIPSKQLNFIDQLQK